MTRTPGDWLKRGRFGDTDAERHNLQRDFDEVAYLEELDERARARNRHPALVEYERDVGSDAERAQNEERSL